MPEQKAAIASRDDRRRRLHLEPAIGIPAASAGNGGVQSVASDLVARVPLRFTEGWFANHAERKQLLALGFRVDTGGTHLSRTMMLAELRHVLEADAELTPERLKSFVLDENVLQKRTGSARRLSLRHLRELYGLGGPPPILWAMIALWPRAGEGQPMLAFLAAAAREAFLRESAKVVLVAPANARVGAADFAASFEEGYAGHYTAKMLAKISRNCASSGTQSGPLEGRVRKVRGKPEASSTAAAYAALLGSLAGFGGPALLASKWIAVLDRSKTEILALLRQTRSTASCGFARWAT